MDLTSIVREGFDGYRALQHAHPFLGSVLTSEFTFVVSDAISQKYIDGKLNAKKLAFTAASAPVFGAMIYGVVETGQIVKTYISDNPLVMAALGPNLVGNGFNAVFFAHNTVGERNGYSFAECAKEHSSYFNGRSFVERAKNAARNYAASIPRREYVNATIVSLTFWNGVQAANFSYVPEEMQTPLSLAVGFGWNIVLTLWSQSGSRKIVSTEQ